MRQGISSKVRSFSRALVSFGLLFVIFSNLNVTYAGPKEWLFRAVAKVVPEVDITRTVQNMTTELVTGVPLGIVTQRNADEVFGCTIQAAINGVPDNPDTPQNEEEPAIMDEAGMLAFLMSNQGITEEQAQETIDDALALDPAVCDFETTSATSRNGGSMFALASTLEGAVESGVAPVSLAAYFKDVARRTPILKDTAYAATYDLVGEDVVLVVWRNMRNLAYGIVSLAMIVVGIMIMMRKKINPQTAVTIQNAFPRLVLSIVLITFSYPIGATIASLVLPAINFSRGFFTGGLSLADAEISVLVFMQIFSLVCIMLPGLTGVAIAVFLLIAFVIILVIALIKVLISYYRIMFNTAISPVIFAVGAIPGKESAVTDWFKNMSVEVAAVTVSFFLLRLSFFVGGALLESAFLSTPTYDQDTLQGMLMADGSFFSRAVVLSITPLAMLVCMGASLKARNMVKGWILGDKAKRK